MTPPILPIAILPIAILIDLEPDVFFIKRSADNSLQGCEEAMACLNEWRGRLCQASGRPIHYSWSVRADPQIAESFGSPAWVLQCYRTQLAQLRQEGDEIGLHVHAYHWDEKQAKWVEDYGNQAWVDECVRMGVDAYQQEYGERPKLFSMGAEWTSQATMQLLDELAIPCDITVVAGKQSIPFPSFWHAYTGAVPDYSMVRQEPFQPSPQDFRLPAQARRDGLWILPLASHRIKAHRSWRRKMYEMVRNPFAGAPPEQVDKLYLGCTPDQLHAALERLTGNSDDPENNTRYLTLVIRADAFADKRRRQAIEECLTQLATHVLVRQFTFVTPLETLQLLTEPSYS